MKAVVGIMNDYSMLLANLRLAAPMKGINLCKHLTRIPRTHRTSLMGMSQINTIWGNLRLSAGWNRDPEEPSEEPKDSKRTRTRSLSSSGDRSVKSDSSKGSIRKGRNLEANLHKVVQQELSNYIDSNENLTVLFDWSHRTFLSLVTL